MNIFKAKKFYLTLPLFVVAFAVGSQASYAHMFSMHNVKDAEFKDPRVISGVVVEIRPDTVLLENDEHIFKVSTHDLSVEDIDAQFLQIGDEMSVSGHPASGAFDAQNILYVDF